MKKRTLLLAAALACWLIWDNGRLSVSRYQVRCPGLPAGLEGMRIAQVSDLHNAEFGKKNKSLLRKLSDAHPDMILFTGDLVNSRHPEYEAVTVFAEEAAKIAPCYYVMGNHEARLPDLPKLLEALEAAGVRMLRNEAITLERKGDTFTLMGVDDPSFRAHYITGDCRPVMTEALEKLTENASGFTVLLSHRPEWFSLYRDFGLNLVFSGHAHGGQFRLPFVGGLVAPNQGFFPAYDAGVITEGETSMVVSRGLGASIIPLRIGNPPELVIAELGGIK